MSSQFMNAFYAGSGSLKSNTNLAFLACDGNQGNKLGIYVNPDIITILLGTGSTLAFDGSKNNPIISFRQKISARVYYYAGVENFSNNNGFFRIYKNSDTIYSSIKSDAIVSSGNSTCGYVDTEFNSDDYLTISGGSWRCAFGISIVSI